MKLAIPTRGTEVDNHFGHCEMYTVVTLDDNGAITKTEILPSPQGCGCKSNIASTFQQIGVKVMLAGGIGEGAINVLNQHGVEVIRGCSGNVQVLAESYLKGKLTDSGSSCSHHHQHNGDIHSCNH
jgi:predicted Fe-Mo cluster-binding NifX family protein